jgi:tRNA-dihydrouridine synthase
MSNLKLSREIIENVLKSTKLPLSVKIRTESFSIGALEFVKNISDLPVSALMVHGRTLKQLFSGPIDLKIIKEIKDNFSGVVLANGGINNFKEIEGLVQATGVDGVGIGRGALGRPWIFSDKCSNLNQTELKDLIFKTAYKHLKLIKKNKGEAGLGEFKGHLAWYFKDFAGASSLRAKIMNAKSFSEIENIIKA